MWVLMHFEQCSKAFAKSECRIGRDILNCNSGEHPEDCYGTKCIGGYLRHKGYLPYSTKSRKSLFPVLEDKLDMARINSAWLKHQILNTNAPIYDSNPYTNVDKLVAQLLQMDDEIIWCSISKGIVKDNLGISFIIEEDKIQIHFHNQDTQTKIIPADSLYLILSDNSQNVGKRMILQAGKSDFIQISVPLTTFCIQLKLGSKRIFFS